MTDGRARDEWARLSVLLALVANAHRDPKRSRTFKPSDFDPFTRPTAIPKVGVDVLKDVFIEGRFPRAQEAPRTEDNSCGSAI